MRKCRNCFKEKPFADFYLSLGRPQYVCKACKPEIIRFYRQKAQEKKIKAGWDRVYGRSTAKAQEDKSDG